MITIPRRVVMHFLGVLAMVLLTGCAATSSSPSPASTIPIRLLTDDSKAKPMTSIPASLGLMAPEVANYQCSGNYEPAARVWPTATTQPPERGLPFWQLTIWCVNPKLKFNLPKGTIRAGMVWTFEVPTKATSLRKAIQYLRPTSDLKISSVGLKFDSFEAVSGTREERNRALMRVSGIGPRQNRRNT